MHGGNIFDDGSRLCGVHAVHLKCGKYVDSMQLQFNDHSYGGVRGGSGGKLHSFRVPPGDAIVSVDVWDGVYVDAIEFHTRNGARSGRIGGNGGNYRRYSAPSGQELVGIKGYDGDLLDHVNFHWGVVEPEGEALCRKNGHQWEIITTPVQGKNTHFSHRKGAAAHRSMRERNNDTDVKAKVSYGIFSADGGVNHKAYSKDELEAFKDDQNTTIGGFDGSYTRTVYFCTVCRAKEIVSDCPSSA